MPLLNEEEKHISKEKARKIFGNLMAINSTHIAFYSELERNLSNNKPITDLFIQYVRRF